VEQPPPNPLGTRDAIVAMAAAFLAGQLVGLLASAGGALIYAAVEGTTEGATESFLVLGPALVASQLALLAIAVAVPIARRLPVRDALGLGSAHPLAFALACTAVLGLAPLSDFVSSFVLETWPDFTLGALTAMEETSRGVSPLILVPVLALTPAIAEESFYRGLMQRALGSSARAVVVVSLLFAFSHLDPPHVAGILPIGFLLGWLALRARSTLVTMVAHFANNAAAVIAWQLGATELEPAPAWIAGGLAVTLLSSILFFFVTRPRERVSSPAAPG
jgi:membrane protease YdiL (CAAX protease family)